MTQLADLQIGDLVRRSVIKGGYWQDTHKCRVLDIRGDKVKLETLSLRGPKRPVWVAHFNVRKID